MTQILVEDFIEKVSGKMKVATSTEISLLIELARCGQFLLLQLSSVSSSYFLSSLEFRKYRNNMKIRN